MLALQSVSLPTLTRALTGNNSAVRAGPMPPPSTQGGGWSVHLYIDHQIIELIANNATAMTAYWSPPAETNTSLRLSAMGAAGTIVAWELDSANNNAQRLSSP